MMTAVGWVAQETVTRRAFAAKCFIAPQSLRSLP
jgi:hypothetical protein